MQLFPFRHLRVLVGVSEIADLTDVAPAVVTNWRGRFETFPRPAVAGARPQFDLARVMAWLDSGEGPRGRQAPAVAPETLWRLGCRAFVLEAPVPEARQALAALLVLHHRPGPYTPPGRSLLVTLAENAEHGEPDATRMFSKLVSSAEDNPNLRGVLTPAFTSLSDDGLFVVFDMIRVLTLDGWTATPSEQLDIALTASDDPAGPMRTTSHHLADLIAALSGVRAGDVVFDPACGEGAALLACARSAEGPITAFGQELDPGTWRLAKARLALADVDTSGLAQPGFDSLREDQHPQLLADVVVLDPPVTEAKAPLGRWLLHASRHLKKSGRAVIVLPLSSVVNVRAARRGYDKAIVEQLRPLADAGLLHAAVVVPRGLRPDVVGPMVVLVLGADPIPSRGTVTALLQWNHPDVPFDDDIAAIRSAVRAKGVIGLTSLDRPRVSARTETTFEALTEQLAEFRDIIEDTVSTGPRRSVTRQMTPSYNRLELMTAPNAPLLLSQSTTSLSRKPHPAKDPLRRDARNLIKRLEMLRSRMPADVYEDLQDAIEQLKRDL